MELGGCGEGALRTSSWDMRLQFLALILAAATPLEAQYRPIGPAPSRLFAVGSGTASPGVSADTLPKVGDHRVAGALIGGVLGGAVAYVFASNAGGDCTTGVPSECSGEDGSAVFGALAGAAVGAGFGYLMGRSTPKARPPANVQPVAPIQDTGIKWWQGGLMGLGVGAAAGAGLGKYYDSNHECHCEDPGMGVYTGAFVGGLLGMLIGAGVAQDNLPTGR
jgi:hypothetical protein